MKNLSNRMNPTVCTPLYMHHQMDAPAKDRGYSRRVMRAVALAASASLVFAACAVYASSQGSTTAISDVILPMGKTLGG